MGLISASFTFWFPPSPFPLEAGVWSRRRRWKHQQDTQLWKILSAAGDPKSWGDQESLDHQVCGQMPTFNQWWYPKDLTKTDFKLLSPCLPGSLVGLVGFLTTQLSPPALRLLLQGSLATWTHTCRRTELSTPRCAVQLPCPSLACPAFYFSMDKLNRDVLGF